MTSLQGDDAGEKTDKTSKQWGLTLQTFCENTTFHGLRNVVEILWIAIVLFATSIYVYQCQNQVRLYLSHPVSWKMSLSRQESLYFPAVTICNQNAFRLVAAADNGSYHWLDDMYRRSDISTFNYTKWYVGNLSMRDVFLQNAHLKEDMIAS
ncbi:hypothetical protein NP493_1635g00020 [Ridgeia piscesae]|uniref:Uncharacterized protein n=1 Tax=Ridgeia piscesae TaxID=27915 RepID=A0AAD9JYM5_RIDPI|nr:hypothetical protein NP493_1635g00020 [Ridgeia piscesae]